MDHQTLELEGGAVKATLGEVRIEGEGAEVGLRLIVLDTRTADQDDVVIFQQDGQQKVRRVKMRINFSTGDAVCFASSDLDVEETKRLLGIRKLFQA